MIRRIHLISGLVMVAYVAMHLINHALGLVSLQAMEWALRRIVVPIRSAAADASGPLHRHPDALLPSALGAVATPVLAAAL